MSADTQQPAQTLDGGRKRLSDASENSGKKKRKTAAEDADALPPAPALFDSHAPIDASLVSPEEAHVFASQDADPGAAFFHHFESQYHHHQDQHFDPHHHPSTVSNVADYDFAVAVTTAGLQTFYEVSALLSLTLKAPVHSPARKQASKASVMGKPAVPAMVNNDSKPYRCDYPGCGKSYKKLNGLISHHFGTHTQADLADVKPYRCGAPDCDKRYRNTNGLAYHIENNHQFEEGGNLVRKPGTFFPSIENTQAPSGGQSGNFGTTYVSAAGDGLSASCTTVTATGELDELSPHELAENPALKAFPCFMCDKIYKSHGGLSYHISLVHPHESMPATSGQDDVYQAFAEVDPSHGGDGGHGAGGLVGLSQEDSDAFKCALCLTDFTDYKCLMEHMSVEHDAIGGIEYVA